MPEPTAEPPLPRGALLRLRPTRVGLLVIVVLLICMTPVAAQRTFLMPLYMIPVVLLWWLLRSGTDVDDSGIRIRAMLGSRHWSWDQLRGLSATERGTLNAVLADGRTVRMPCARARHLRLIAKVSAGRVPELGSDVP